jgi:signal transduction histidine kinase
MATQESDFRAEAVELQREIMNQGVIPALLLLGWLGMFFALFASLVTIAWERIATQSAVIILGMLCVLLRDQKHGRAALWLCGAGGWALAAVNFLAHSDPFSVFWMGIACALLMLIVSPAAGSVATAAACLLVIDSAFARSSADLSPSTVAQVIAPLLTLATLSYVVAHVLFRTLEWMSHGYATAIRQSDELREQSARLALALRSLDQTSFALARANEQLEIMVDFAEQARRSKQEFAANISHELRAPLNVIIGFSDVVIDAISTMKARIPHDVLLDLDAIYRNARHLLRLVNDILDLSQMDASYMTVSLAPMQVPNCIQSAIENIKPLAEARSLYINVDAPAGLPMVQADQMRIQQVLLNLVNNALRFTARGGVTIRARLYDAATGVSANATGAEASAAAGVAEGEDESEGEGAGVVISVADSGIGIAPEDQARIFEPFVQAGGAGQAWG